MYSDVDLLLSWDNVKAGKNLKKHGVSFEEAQTVWGDNNSKEYLDGPCSLWGETRFHRIGISSLGRILTIVFTEPSEYEVRLISARKSTRRERNKYGRRIRLL